MSLRVRTGDIQSKICEGIKLRRIVKERVEGKKVSAYLSNKEKKENDKCNTLVSKMKTDYGDLVDNIGGIFG